MAHQLLRDPPRPHILRQKTYRNAGYACEVAHLAGVGPYASDAWRLFCKKSFYAGHQIVVADEWRTLEPEYKDLRRYVERERCEGQVRLLTDDVAFRIAALQLSSASASCSKAALQPGLLIGSGDSALRVPQRLLDQARGISLASCDNADTTRSSRVVATGAAGGSTQEPVKKLILRSTNNRQVEAVSDRRFRQPIAGENYTQGAQSCCNGLSPCT